MGRETDSCALGYEEESGSFINGNEFRSYIRRGNPRPDWRQLGYQEGM